MSDNALKKSQKKQNSVFYKWSLIILSILVLEAGGIFAAVKINESINKNEEKNLLNVSQEILNQKDKLSNLESLPLSISSNTQQITAFSRTLNLLSDNLTKLNEKIESYEIEKIKNNLATLVHKVESLEEQGNKDSLILSLALLIKENALYHRDFSKEADILDKISFNQSAIRKNVQIIKSMENTSIENNDTLAKEFHSIIQNYTFKKETEESVAQNNKNISKGVKVLRDTVSHLHFDKVMVLKKERKTEQQKKILARLTELVDNYEFEKAITFINTTTDFQKQDNEALTLWINKAKNKISFDSAISHILSAQLNALREDIKKDTLVLPKAENTDKTQDNPVLSEVTSND